MATGDHSPHFRFNLPLEERDALTGSIAFLREEWATVESTVQRDKQHYSFSPDRWSKNTLKHVFKMLITIAHLIPANIMPHIFGKSMLLPLVHLVVRRARVTPPRFQQGALCGCRR